MKLINVIFGAYAIVGSLFCMFWPKASFLNCGWIIAFLLVAWGLCAIAANAMARKDGGYDKVVQAKGIVCLIIGILAIVACILSLTTTLLGVFSLAVILFMITIWVFVEGIITLVSAVGRKKKGEMWVISLVFGIILIAASLFAIIGWLVNLQDVTFFIGLILMVLGVRLAFGLFDYDKLSYKSRIW